MSAYLETVSTNAILYIVYPVLIAPAIVLFLVAFWVAITIMFEHLGRK